VLDWLRRAIVSPLAQHWLSHSRSSWRSLPSPEASGAVSAPGPDPDRILLVGGGISVGWGTESHQDALGGHLARGISAATDRGVVMDIVADDILSTSPELPAEVLRLLRTVDAVILTPGDVDVLLFLPAALYAQRLESMIDQMTEVAPANTRIFIVATAPLRAAIALPLLLRPWASRLGSALNARARRLCREKANTIFIPFAPAGIAGRGGSGRTYAAWAEVISPAIASQLNSCEDTSIR
jgi:hypothetical protein